MDGEKREGENLKEKPETKRRMGGRLCYGVKDKYYVQRNGRQFILESSPQSKGEGEGGGGRAKCLE